MELRSEVSPLRSALLRLPAAMAFLLILIGGFEPFYLRIFRTDRAREAAAFAELPFHKLPGLQTFLKGVDAHTPAGAQIAIWVPFHQWDGGYGYVYNRASYLLPGKQVVPLLALHEDRVDLSNLARADYLASFDERIAAPGFENTWQDDHGLLMKAAVRSASPSSSAVAPANAR